MPVYAIKHIETGYYFDGFGNLTSVINAKTFSDWADCPIEIAVEAKRYRFHMNGPQSMRDPDAFKMFYVNKDKKNVFKIVELTNEEREKQNEYL